MEVIKKPGLHEAVSITINELYDGTLITIQRLNTCQAHVLQYEKYAILRSYNTLVAIYDKDHNKVYSLGNYSATTVQHIYKFARLLDAKKLIKCF